MFYRTILFTFQLESMLQKWCHCLKWQWRIRMFKQLYESSSLAKIEVNKQKTLLLLMLRIRTPCTRLCIYVCVCLRLIGSSKWNPMQWYSMEWYNSSRKKKKKKKNGILKTDSICNRVNRECKSHTARMLCGPLFSSCYPFSTRIRLHRNNMRSTCLLIVGNVYTSIPVLCVSIVCIPLHLSPWKITSIRNLCASHGCATHQNVNTENKPFIDVYDEIKRT